MDFFRLDFFFIIRKVIAYFPLCLALTFLSDILSSLWGD